MVTMAPRESAQVTGITQMGGEGVQWLGQAPFSDIDHIFQNVGDGTYFHSGQLALQACVAAGVNITYKILYNQVVAMTGAQDAPGGLGVPELTRKLAAEGVGRIIVCADEPEKYGRNAGFAPGVTVWHRDRIDDAQRELREVQASASSSTTSSARPRPAACASAARSRRAPCGSSSTKPCARLRRLRRQEQLPLGAAGRHRAGAQDPHRPDQLQHRLQLPRR